MHNEIKSGIEKASNELIELISSANDEQFNEMPSEESWSVAQVGGHLLKSYALVDFLKDGKTMQAERSAGKEIEEIKKIFLDFNAKYISAESLRPADLPIQKEELLKGLQMRILQMQELIQTKDLTEICIGRPFPGIGELSRLEWLYVILYHTQRHIHQIKNILESMNTILNNKP